jgi:hypothetical protein
MRWSDHASRLEARQGRHPEACEQLFAESPHAAFEVKKQVFGDDLLSWSGPLM